MSSWDIQPNGVNSVVQKTSGVAKDFEGEAKAYASALENAVNAGGSQIVAEAVQGFATHHQNTFQNIVDRTVRVLTGAVDATKAYLEGDMTMAAEAQKNASK